VDSAEPFFVFGSPRSGTTALARLLNASNSIACLFYEGNLLYRLWNTLSRHDVLSEAHEDIVLDVDITAKHCLIDKAKEVGSKKVIFSESVIEHFVNEFRNALKYAESPFELYQNTASCFFQTMSSVSGAHVVGDKVPDYVNIPDVLCEAIPECRMLYIQRDERATVHSVMEFTKGNFHLFAFPNAFAIAFGLFLKKKGMQDLMAGMSKSKILSVRQEELYSDPGSVGKKVVSFLGVEKCSDMMNYAGSMAKRASVKNWRNEMTREDVEAVEGVFMEFEPEGVIDSSSPTEENAWRQKARAIMPLTRCANFRIHSIVSEAKNLFSIDDDEETLALTLMQFADYAHARADHERAYVIFLEVGRLVPSNPVLWFKFAELCFDMKRLKEARAYYEKAESQFPNTDFYAFIKSKTCYKLGMIAKLDGRFSDAGKCFKHSLGLFPNFKLAKAMVQTV
jgi:tetratricopeptide (TPR) repeat protein